MATAEIKPLPDKLSALLELALDDLQKIERDRRYTVHMGCWHLNCGGQCYVCLAGAVMVRELHQPRLESVDPSAFEHSQRRQLLALDWLRKGYVSYALATLRQWQTPEQKHPHPPNFCAVPYDEDRKGFYNQMRRLVIDLRRCEL